MAEAFLRLTAKDRLDALGVAADRLGRPAHLLEKDVWVVWAIEQLFGSPVGTNLVFRVAPLCRRPTRSLTGFPRMWM
jgi:hypothetical protein